METSNVKITCPKCNHPIDVDAILYHQLEERADRKFKDQIAAMEKAQEENAAKIRAREAEIAKREQALEATVDQQIREGLSAKEAELRVALKKSLDAENEERIKLMQRELDEQGVKLRELNTTKGEIEKLKREKANLREEIELENQKKINETLEAERARIVRIEAEKNELKLSEREKVIDQLKVQLAEAQRKVEQGSMQLQGEVQELGIEEWLRTSFPLDSIDEVRKGQRGADCVQVVNTYTSPACGVIYYESKRTKDFQVSWIEKFRNDMREQNANIGVLVTDVLPKGWERMGLQDGVWICTYQEFKGLCFVLRESIIQIANAVSSQENKGDKMVMLYDYLTSNEFRLQVEAIVEGFTQMQTDLLAEKRSIQGHWKKREKQIQKVLLNTNYMYSSIQGIAGSAIQPIPHLELPDAGVGPDEEDE